MSEDALAPRAATPAYASVRRDLFDFCGSSALGTSLREHIAMKTRDIFDMVDEGVLGVVDGVVLLETLFVSFSAFRIGRGIFSGAISRKDGGGVFGLGRAASEFRVGLAEVLFGVGSVLFGNEGDVSLAEAGDMDESMEDDGTGIPLLKAALDALCLGYYASQYSSDVRFQLGQQSMVHPFRMIGRIARRFGVTGKEVTRDNIMRANSSPETADSRAMALFIDMLSDDDGVPDSETLLLEVVIDGAFPGGRRVAFGEEPYREEDDATAEMYKVYEQYCKERIAGARRCVARTGVDINDYGDRFSARMTV